MPKQIIKATKLVPVKYHGKVKYLVFECNYCHREFVKPESYYKKQLKTRKNACCFCSPQCLLDSQGRKDCRKKPARNIDKAFSQKDNPKKKGFFSSFIKSLLLPKNKS